MPVTSLRPGFRYGRFLLFLILAAAAGGGYWYYHYKRAHLHPPAPPQHAAQAASKPRPSLQVQPNGTKKAFVLSYTGYEIHVRPLRNPVGQEGASGLVFVKDWPLTMEYLGKDAKLVCYAGPNAGGQPLGQSNGPNPFSVPDLKPGVDYSLHFRRKGGSFDRPLATFKIVPVGQAQPQAQPHPVRRRHHRKR